MKGDRTGTAVGEEDGLYSYSSVEPAGGTGLTTKQYFSPAPNPFLRALVPRRVLAITSPVSSQRSQDLWDGFEEMHRLHLGDRSWRYLSL